MAQQPTNDVRLSIVRLSGPENWSTFRYGCTLLMERARVLPVVLRQEPRPTEVTLLSFFLLRPNENGGMYKEICFWDTG